MNGVERYVPKKGAREGEEGEERNSAREELGRAHQIFIVIIYSKTRFELASVVQVRKNQFEV